MSPSGHRKRGGASSKSGKTTKGPSASNSSKSSIFEEPLARAKKVYEQMQESFTTSDTSGRRFCTLVGAGEVSTDTQAAWQQWSDACARFQNLDNNLKLILAEVDGLGQSSNATLEASNFRAAFTKGRNQFIVDMNELNPYVVARKEYCDRVIQAPQIAEAVQQWQSGLDDEESVDPWQPPTPNPFSDEDTGLTGYLEDWEEGGTDGFYTAD